MRVLVCGDREWNDRALLFRILDEAHAIAKFTCVVEGEAKGADLMAREWAEARGVAVAPYPALWERFGRAAGPIRNRQMILEGKPDFVIAFHKRISASKGTADMLYAAELAGIPRELFPQ